VIPDRVDFLGHLDQPGVIEVVDALGPSHAPIR
jgi:hypothetical protein